MAYDDISGCGAIICTHVTVEKNPILRAVRGRVLDATDSGWQFTCGGGGHTAASAKLWALFEVVDLDATVRSILDAKVRTAFERASKDATWIEVIYPE